MDDAARTEEEIQAQQAAPQTQQDALQAQQIEDQQQALQAARQAEHRAYYRNGRTGPKPVPSYGPAGYPFSHIYNICCFCGSPTHL